LPHQSLFEFTGTIGPSELVPPIRATYRLQRPEGTVTVDVEEYVVRLRFAATYESFDDLYYQIVEFVLAFFAVGTINTGIAVELQLDEWTETPLDRVDAEGMTHRVRGQILHRDPDAIPPVLLPEDYTFGLARGIQWSQEIATNAFFRRALLDFNHALKHSLNDVPIYLARSIESTQNFFGGEEALISSLSVSNEVKLVKRLANDAMAGLHTRHAARTEAMTSVTRDQVLAAIDAVRSVLLKFQIHISDQPSDQGPLE